LRAEKELAGAISVPYPSRKRETSVGYFTKDIETLEDLLIHGLQDIYYAEQQIIKGTR